MTLQIKIKVMYNIHQYNNEVRMQQQVKAEEERLTKYLHKHQDFKEKASIRIKERADSFVKEQAENPKHFVFEDDHYVSWRPIKQFRDVQDGNKFLSFKSFRHKPHYEMDKFFNQRERRQIKHLSERKEHLVKSNIIPEEHRGRSLRCQGPLNPKIQFRERKKDHQYLQPRLRFANVTDRQRMNESSMSFDNKFKSLYNSFEMTKSKIGRTVVSPSKQRRYSLKPMLDFVDDASSDLTKSKPFYFEKEAYPLDEQCPSPIFESKQMINPQTFRRQDQSFNREDSLSPTSKKKMYFKLAKTMHLLGKDPQEKAKIDQLLKKTQYDRKKDLTNIRNNLHGENHFKRPIL